MKQQQSTFKLKFTIAIYLFWGIVAFLFNSTDFANSQSFLPGALLLAGLVLHGLYFGVIFFSAEAAADKPDTNSKTHKIGIARAIALLMPVFVIFIIDSSKLFDQESATTVGLTKTTTSVEIPAVESATPTTSIGTNEQSPLQVTLLDIHRGLDNYVSKKVQTVGMIKFDAPETPEGANVLFRFVMVCCGNDMQPVAILVRGDVPEGAKNEDWVEITGRVNTFKIEGHTAIEIQAEEIKVVTQPDPPFINMTF